MAVFTYRCGQCEGGPTFESENRLHPACGTEGILQTASRYNADGSNWVDAKPVTSPVTPELSGELPGAEDRPIPASDLGSPISGWCGKPEDRPN